MNNCQFTGRLVRDPETRYTAGENSMAICRFTLAVDRKFKRDGDASADYPSFTAFNKNAENIQKYFCKGKPIIIEKSHVQTGSYVNKDGVKVYTTDFVVDEWDFVPSDNTQNAEQINKTTTYKNATPSRTSSASKRNDSFMNVPVDMDEELPF